MGPSTRALLAGVGIPPGSTCLDVGCGGGDVTFELARAVGPSGRVVGVDRDRTKLEIAQREAGDLRLSNMVFDDRDLTAWQPGESFDIVYARFILTHLASPAALVATLCRCIRPGGAMIVEDIDFRGHFCEPDCPAFRRYVELYTRTVQNRGADPNIGPRLPALLREAGLHRVEMSLVHPAALEGGVKLLCCVTLETIADAVLEDGLVTEQELGKTIEELYTFARDPQTVMGGPRVFQAWGRRAAMA
jgi:SAM-dependent methyltransferase